MNVFVFQIKAYREKMNTALIRQYLDISQTRASHLRVTHVHISQKHFRKFLPFQKIVIILESNASRVIMITALTSNNTWTYPKLGLLI